jgi:hypothetical protein
LTFDADATNLPAGVVPVVVAVIIGVSLAATFLGRRVVLVELFALWMCVFFLAYTAWEHHYVMLLPALVLLVALRPRARPLALAVFVLVALPAPYLLVNAATDSSLPPPGSLVTVQEQWPAWGVIAQHSMKPLPVLVLWSYLVWKSFAEEGGEELVGHGGLEPPTSVLSGLRSNQLS